MPQAWTVIEEEVVFAAQPIVEVVRQTVVTEKGTLVPDFYKVLLRPFVVCVPITDEGRVLTLWQYKHGPERTSLTFPGGFRHPDEPAADACHRELLEETGYVSDELVDIGEFVDNGNQRGCIGSYFVALNCQKVQQPASGDLETAEIALMDPPDIDDALRIGSIRVVHHVAAWSLARLWGFGQ